MPVADLHSKILDPPGSKFFQFHAVFGKNWQNRMLAPPGEFAHPPRGNPGSATVCSTDDLPIRCSNGQHTFLGILGMSKALVYSRLSETQGFHLLVIHVPWFLPILPPLGCIILFVKHFEGRKHLTQLRSCFVRVSRQ